MREVLARRDVRLLLAGQAVSQAGDWLYSVALVVWVLDATGSAAWVAAVGVVRLLPWILLSPVGGVVADRFDRRRTLIAMDVLQLATMVGLALVAAMNGSPAVALAIAAVSALAGVVASPSLQAAWPLLVPERGLASVNALLSGILNLSMVLGPAIGAVLLLLGSPAAAFALNAGTFAVSAAAYALVRSPMNPAAEAKATGTGTGGAASGVRAAFATANADLRAGADAILASRASIAVVAVVSAVLFAYGVQTVLWAILADERLAAGVDAVTLLYVAYGIGGLLAAVPAARASEGSRAAVVVGMGLALGGLAIAALGAAQTLPQALALVLVQGLVVTISDILVITLLQRVVGATVLGRALGAMDSVTSVTMVAGSLLAAPLIAAGGIGFAFGVAGLSVAALGVVIIAVLARQPALSARDAQRVAFLARLPLFDGAPRFALEGLAGVATDRRAAPGEVILREGDAPDDLYVIVAGAMLVTVGADGRELNRIGEGDVFGEIGLLRGTPRTATVSAITEADLLRIPGETFLALVRQGVASRATLGRTISTRLSQQRTAERPVARG